MKSKTKIMINTKGQTSLTISSIDIFEIQQETNRFTHKGGVNIHKERFTTTISPKKIGSMPNCVMRGKKTGAKMIIAAFVSIKVPTIRSKILIVNKIILGFSEIVKNHSAIIIGILSLASNQPKAEEVEIISITTAAVTAESKKIFGRSLILISLYTKTPIIKAYKTATAAASVGVNIPP